MRDTLGTIVFQEQVIQVAMALAGFSAGEAEGLRRAMSRKRSEEAILAYREQFIAGARERGATTEVAERVFEQIRGFSGFGFPKAHAVAFGLLAYQSTWLRVHYGPEFLCSLLNEQPMGFYPPDALVHEAQRRGIEVLPPDVNRSGVECSVEGPSGGWRRSAVGPGLHNRPAGGGRPGARRGARARRPLLRPRRPRVALRRRAARARAARLGGACEGIGGRDDLRRREDLWRLGVARAAAAGPAGRGGAMTRTEAAAHQLSLPLPIPAAPSLRELDSWERLVADYASTGIAIAEHPMALLRPSLERARVARAPTSTRVPDGRRVEIAGMVVARQRPATARGVVFMLLEDELGTINVVVPPPVYERHRLAVRTASFAQVSGQAGAPRGGDQRGRLGRPPAATPDQPGAEVRHIEPPAERETGRRAGGEPRARRSPRTGRRAGRRGAGRAQLRPARAVTARASSLAEHMFRLAAP